MIQIDLSKLQQFVSVPYEMELAPRLHIVHGHLQKGNGVGGEFTGWVHLPESYDRAEFARIEQAAQKIRSDSQALVVIGIGGSYLGARGVIECLCSPNYNLKKKDTPNIYFIGNGLSSDQLSETMELLGSLRSSFPSRARRPSRPWRSGSSAACLRSGTARRAPPRASTPRPTGTRARSSPSRTQTAMRRSSCQTTSAGATAC